MLQRSRLRPCPAPFIMGEHTPQPEFDSASRRAAQAKPVAQQVNTSGERLADLPSSQSARSSPRSVSQARAIADTAQSPVRRVNLEGPESQTPSRIDLAKRKLGDVLDDKWTLDDLLGVGGMAAVYSATHRNGARAAIKLLPFTIQTGPDVCQRLLREGHLANRIQHDAVVRVLDDHIDYEHDHAYIVMELLTGETARQRFDRLGPFDPLIAVELMLELAHCLSAAHAANVIHRDIKPENLFLTDKGLKVLDFGIARALDGAGNLTQTGTTMGTPAYMAPEQARGKQDEITPRTDLYALGATLLYLVTGETPHSADNPLQLMVLAAWTPAPSALDLCPTLPQALADVIDRCCAFEAADRYPDAASVVRALEDVREQLRTSGTRLRPLPPPNPRLPARPPPRRTRSANDETVADAGLPSVEHAPDASQRLDQELTLESDLPAALRPRPLLRSGWAVGALIGAGVLGAWILFGGDEPRPEPRMLEASSEGADAPISQGQPSAEEPQTSPATQQTATPLAADAPPSAASNANSAAAPQVAAASAPRALRSTPKTRPGKPAPAKELASKDKQPASAARPSENASESESQRSTAGPQIDYRQFRGKNQ